MMLTNKLKAAKLNNKGFTLAELMIALVVSGVVATVIIALVTSFFRNAGRIDSGVNAWNRIQDANVQLQRDVNDAAQINMADRNRLELFILRDIGEGTRCFRRDWVADPELGTLSVQTFISAGTEVNPAECSFGPGSEISEPQVIIRGLEPIANHPNAAEPRFVQDGVFTYITGLDSPISEHLLPLHRSNPIHANILNRVGRIEWSLSVAPDGRNLDITRDLRSAGAFFASHINTGGGDTERPEAPEVSIMNPNETIQCPQAAIDYMYTGGPRGTGLVVGVDRPAICWNDTSSALVNTTGWTIFRLMFPTGAELGSNRWHTVAQLPANEVFWVDPDLPAGYTALLVVQAEIATGNVLAPDGIGPESNSVISGLRPTPEIRMNAVGNQQTIDLTWEVVGGVHDAGIFGFDIYRDGVLIARVPASVTSFRDGPAEAYTGILLPENLRNLTRGHVQPTNTAAAAQSAAFRQLTWANRPGARAGEAGFGFTFDYQIVPVNRWEQIAVNETSAREGNEGRADLGINATREMRNRRAPGGAFQNSGILRHGLEVRNDQAPQNNEFGIVRRALPNPQSPQTVSTRLVAAFTAPAAPVLAPVVHAVGAQGASGAARTHTLSWTPAPWLNADGATTSRGITAVTAGGTGNTAGVSVNGVQPSAIGHRDAGWQVLYSLNSRAAFSNNQANDVTPSAIRAVPFNPPATDNATQFAVPVNGSFNTQAGTTAATITPANANLTIGAISSPSAAVNTFTFGTPTAANPNALLTGRHYHYAMFGVNGSGRGPVNHETTISSWTRPANPTCAIGDITTRSMVVGSTLAATLDETYTFAQTVNLNGTTWARHNIRHSVGDTDITSRPWVAQNAAANELAQGISGAVGNTGTAGSGQRFNRLGAGSVAANTHTRNHDFQVQATGQGGFSDVVDCVDNHSSVTRTGTLPGPRFATLTLGIRTDQQAATLTGGQTLGVRTNTRTAEVDVQFMGGWAVGTLPGAGTPSWTNNLAHSALPDRTTLGTHNPTSGGGASNTWRALNTLRFDPLGRGNGDSDTYALTVTNSDGFNTVTATRSGVTTQVLNFNASNIPGCTDGTGTPRAITRSTLVRGQNTTIVSPPLAHGVQGAASEPRWVHAGISDIHLQTTTNRVFNAAGNGLLNEWFTFCEGSINRGGDRTVNHARTGSVQMTDGHNTRTNTTPVSLVPINVTARAWNEGPSRGVGHNLSATGSRDGCVENTATLHAHTWVSETRVGSVYNQRCTDQLPDSRAGNIGAHVTVSDGLNSRTHTVDYTTGYLPAPPRPAQPNCGTSPSVWEDESMTISSDVGSASRTCSGAGNQSAIFQRPALSDTFDGRNSRAGEASLPRTCTGTCVAIPARPASAGCPQDPSANTVAAFWASGPTLLGTREWVTAPSQSAATFTAGNADWVRGSPRSWSVTCSQRLFWQGATRNNAANRPPIDPGTGTFDSGFHPITLGCRFNPGGSPGAGGFTAGHGWTCDQSGGGIADF